jgi:flagellin
MVGPSSGVGSLKGQDVSVSALKKTNRALKKILRNLATGLRINQASDDAAGLSISEQLRTQIRGFKMASQNVTDAESALNIADGTANEVTGILQRQRELALQATNATLTNEQRQAIDVEYQQLNQEIDRITGAAQFNTQNVANGTGLGSGAAQVQAGANAGETVQMPLVDISANTLGVDTTSVATAAGAGTALDAIDTALQRINTQRSGVGAMTNRMQSIRNNLNIAEINTQAAESVLRDQDMAMGLAELTRNRLLQEGGIRTFARYNEISANHLFALLQ